jgi:hypothetical protein
MTEGELVQFQIELEYYISPQGKLVPFPDSAGQSRFVVYETSKGFIYGYERS